MTDNAKKDGAASAFSVSYGDDIATVTLDVPGEAVNTLNDRFAPEFDAVLDELEVRSPRAVVLRSGKADSFIAGADVKMLQAADSRERARAISELGQRLMNRLETLPCPVVAAIHGACLGGGLELAVACDARVVSDHKKTKLGLPEVQLGLIPGAGGTQRLPRLIGVQAALDLMLTGRQLNARKARKLGLVDEVVPAALLLRAARELALSLAEQPTSGGPLERMSSALRGLDMKEELQELLLEDNRLGRRVLFDQARKKVLSKTHGNYPAPSRIIAAIEAGLRDGIEAGLRAESEAFGDLVMSDEARQLIGIFQATTAMKKDRGVDDVDVEPHPVDKVGMIGAGLMGAGIAYVTTSVAKIPVRLKDRDAEGVGHGLAYVRDILDGRVKRRRLTQRELLERMNMISPTTQYNGLSGAQVVIEAVFEDLALKHQILRDVESNAADDVIFASNTSTLPITEIAKASKHPETVIGMHYFSPVHKMPLLEVIRTEKTAPWVVATCVELGKKQGKTVIVVGDGVGFYTSRILAPYMNEAFHILSEGVKVEDIDGALLKFGYPVGPVKLLDEVGIDVAQKAGGVVKAAFGHRIDAPRGMERLVADGRLGRKSKKGFYLYEGKKKGVDPTVYETLSLVPSTRMDAEVIAERCALQMVNEAAHCFGEGILRSARDGDIGAIFGLGFPPFRGGPFRYADSLGVARLVERLEHYASKHGPRFAPAPVLTRLAKHGGSFHGDNAARPGQDPAAKVRNAS